MADNRRQVLDMLAEGKITVDEAERLLSLVDQPPVGDSGGAAAPDAGRRDAKYLRVVVEPDPEAGEAKAERVNVRVPMALIRAGVKLTGLIPMHAGEKVNEALREHGIDLETRGLKAEDLEQLIDALSDLEVEVEDGKQKVHIYAE